MNKAALAAHDYVYDIFPGSDEEHRTAMNSQEKLRPQLRES
jgi:hypothetical protein